MVEEAQNDEDKRVKCTTIKVILRSTSQITKQSKILKINIQPNSLANHNNSSLFLLEIFFITLLALINFNNAAKFVKCMKHQQSLLHKTLENKKSTGSTRSQR